MKEYWNIFVKELTDGDPYFLQIKGFNIRWYSVLILLGALISLIMLLKEARRVGADKDFIFNLAFWTIIIGFIGARLYYVIFKFSLFKDDLLSIFKIWKGGLAIHGGIIAGAITMYVYCKKNHFKFLKATDMAVPCLLLAQAIGRWGNFFNGEAHGVATTYFVLKNKLHLPDFIINGMYIDNKYYHPTFFYESIYCLIGFIILSILRRLKYIKRGQLTGIYLMYYSVGRFFIESLRTDSLMFMGFRVAQIVSVILFIIGLGICMIVSRKGRFEDLYNEEQSGPLNF